MISDYGDEFIPVRKTLLSCGCDFFIPCDLEMEPDRWYTIDLGIHLEEGDLKQHQFLMIVPRSSTGMKHGLRLRNTVGIIDADYRDSIKASIAVDIPHTYHKGDRILQGIVLEWSNLGGVRVENYKRTGGIGSTGA